MLTTIEWGSFTSFCMEADLPICRLWNTTDPLSRTCSPIGISIGGQSIPQFSDFIVCAISILLASIMVFRAHFKRAAVGRKEINILLFFYIIQLVCQILSAEGILPSSTISLYITFAQIGLIFGVFWTLLLNGLVGYQFVEDGAPLSFYGILISALLLSTAQSLFSADMSLDLFGRLAQGIGAYQSPALFVTYLLWPLAAVLVYVLLLTVLVSRNLGDQKPLFQLYLSAGFFAASQVMMLVVNSMICEGTNKMMDGTPFASLCNLLAVAFLYRFWDSITEGAFQTDRVLLYNQMG